MGCDGIHPEVHLDLTRETRREMVEFMENGGTEGKKGRNKLVQRCCSFLIPKGVTSEGPIAPEADVDTLVGSCLGSMKWQQGSN